MICIDYLERVSATERLSIAYISNDRVAALLREHSRQEGISSSCIRPEGRDGRRRSVERAYR